MFCTTVSVMHVAKIYNVWKMLIHCRHSKEWLYVPVYSSQLIQFFYVRVSNAKRESIE